MQERSSELPGSVTPAAAASPEAVALAARDVMTIEDVTAGVAPGNSVRVRGRLIVPPDEAWRTLAERFRPLGSTPLLRRRDDGPGEEVLALPVTFRPATARPILALVMFGLTVLSCLFVGAQMVEGLATFPNWNLLDGIPFTVGLLAILVSHEFGHYLTARRLGSPTSLPYFIPMPFGPFGTFGAFITMSMPPRNRRHLLAIGAAGPLAGLVVALPVLWLGLTLSRVVPLPPGGYQMEGNSLLYAGMKALVFGRLLPSGGMDVWVHQLAFAGWAGLLVTGLNLIPAGQLDGGHIVYALLGRKGARTATWIVLAALVGLSFMWTGWVLWLVLVLLLGRMQDMPLDDITELTGGQRVLAAAMVAVFFLVFVPIPLTLVP
jgi:membrane-associated protease RseP (regulator of RpoE activity)